MATLNPGETSTAAARDGALIAYVAAVAVASIVTFAVLPTTGLRGDVLASVVLAALAAVRRAKHHDAN